MKMFFSLALTGALLLCLCACSQSDVLETVSPAAASTPPTEQAATQPETTVAETAAAEATVAETTVPEITAPEETEPTPAIPETTEPAAAQTEETIPATTSVPEPEPFVSYSQLAYFEFTLSSGAGAWDTTLHIDEFGGFSGVYHDSDMGDKGDDYPRGTVYYCAFSGQLGIPEPIDRYTYKLPILDLQITRTPDTQEIRNGIRYYYTTAIGLRETRELLLYLPGTPLDRLPEKFRLWIGGILDDEDSVLPLYGLYNETQQQGFSGRYRIYHLVRDAENTDVTLQSDLEEAATQTEMNALAQQRYKLWDDLLNDLWAVLNDAMAPDAFAELTREQLGWIQAKEKAASDAAAEFADGSLAPMVRSTVAADLTKKRVYYLMTYLPE